MKLQELRIAMARFLFPMVVVVLGCDGTGPSSPETSSGPSDGIEFVLRQQIPTTLRPHGVAVTPDGAQVIVATYWGRRILILDGENYHPVREPIDYPENWGVEITPDGRRALVASRRGAWVLELSTGEPELFLDVVARRVISNADGSSYYTAGSVLGRGAPAPGAIVRIDTDGTIAAELPTSDGYHYCFALSQDERNLLAARFHDNHLLVMDPITLQIRTEIAMGSRLSGCLLIPLDEPGFVLLVSTGDGLLELTKVNYPDGTIVTREILDLRVAGREPSWGRGNPWSRFGSGRLIVPTNFGFLILNAFSGKVEEFRTDIPKPEWNTLCCDVAYDPLRNRLVVVGSVFTSSLSDSTGQIVVYDIVESG